MRGRTNNCPASADFLSCSIMVVLELRDIHLALVTWVGECIGFDFVPERIRTVGSFCVGCRNLCYDHSHEWDERVAQGDDDRVGVVVSTSCWSAMSWCPENANGRFNLRTRIFVLPCWIESLAQSLLGRKKACVKTLLVHNTSNWVTLVNVASERGRGFCYFKFIVCKGPLKLPIKIIFYFLLYMKMSVSISVSKNFV